MKIKIGTALEDDIVRKLKITAAKEGRAIRDVLQDALLNYFKSGNLQQSARLEAVNRLCSKPFHVEADELRHIVEEDYYDQ